MRKWGERMIHWRQLLWGCGSGLAKKRTQTQDQPPSHYHLPSGEKYQLFGSCQQTHKWQIEKPLGRGSIYRRAVYLLSGDHGRGPHLTITVHHPIFSHPHVAQRNQRLGSFHPPTQSRERRLEEEDPQEAALTHHNLTFYRKKLRFDCLGEWEL